ncbi:TPA: hypothetical protein HA318_00025 [Candidatus Micrarchaeota archaeon]|nr:hypothetical protein [Candidatus Micrarchaeota archaeon]
MARDFESELTASDDEEAKQQYLKDDYEDRTGENTAVTTEDKYIEVKRFKCVKCGRTARQRATFLFKPRCCGHQMAERSEAEKRMDFGALVKKAAKAKKASEKEAKKKKAKPASKKPLTPAKTAAAKPKKKANTAKTPIKAKPKPKKALKTLKVRASPKKAGKARKKR